MGPFMFDGRDDPGLFIRPFHTADSGRFPLRGTPAVRRQTEPGMDGLPGADGRLNPVLRPLDRGHGGWRQKGQARTILESCLLHHADMPVFQQEAERTRVEFPMIEMEMQHGCRARMAGPAMGAIRHQNIIDGLGMGLQTLPQAQGIEHAGRGEGDRGNPAVEFRLDHLCGIQGVRHHGFDTGPGERDAEGQPDKTAAGHEDIGFERVRKRGGFRFCLCLGLSVLLLHGRYHARGDTNVEPHDVAPP